MTNNIDLFTILILIFIFIYIVLIYFDILNQKHIVPTSGVYFATLNLASRRVEPMEISIKWNFRHPGDELVSRLENAKSGVAYADFLKFLKKESAQRIDIAINQILDQKNDVVSYSVKNVETIWNDWFLFDFNIENKHNSRDYVFLKLNWRNTQNTRVEKNVDWINKRRITKTGLVKLSESRTIALSTFKNDAYIDDWAHNRNVFWNFVQKLGIYKNIKWMDNRNTISIFIHSINDRKLNAILEKIKQIEKEKSFNVKDDYFEFISNIGIFEIERYLKLEEVEKTLQRIDFSIFKAVESSRAYFIIDKKNKDIDDEFEKFIHDKNAFESELSQNYPGFVWHEITSYKTKKQIGYFLDSKINHLDNKNYKILVKNNYYFAKIVNANVNAFATDFESFAKIIKNKKLTNEIIISNIMLSWLIDNYENIRVKNVIYIINQDLKNFDVELIQNIISKLRSISIFVGFKIQDFSIATSSLIAQIKPRLLVIDKKISQNLGKDLECEKAVLSIKELCNYIKAAMIYENLDQSFDDISAEYFGLSVVY